MSIKKIHLILEYLAKCKSSSPQTQEVYMCMLDTLANNSLCAKSMFTCKQISKLLKGEVDSYDSAKIVLDKISRSYKSAELLKQKSDIYNSLMGGNFPSHKDKLSSSIEDFEASLSSVEVKMYMMIKNYIMTLSEALEFFMIFDVDKKSSIESVSSYGVKIHENILQNLFYDEEKIHIDDALRELAAIYIGLYYRSFYG